MSAAKAVVVLPRAEQDIRHATAYYRDEGGQPLALKWAEAVARALRHIGAHPQTGSSRYAVALSLGGLRFWPVKTFPYLVFYVERETRVDVWRVLQSQRDIPAWMAGPGK